MKSLRVFVAGIPAGTTAEDIRQGFADRGIVMRFQRFEEDAEGILKNELRKSCVVEVFGISAYALALNGPPVVVGNRPLSCRPFLQASAVRKIETYTNARRLIVRGAPADVSQDKLKLMLELELGSIATIEPFSSGTECLRNEAKGVDYAVVFVRASEARKAGNISELRLGGFSVSLHFSDCRKHVIAQPSLRAAEPTSGDTCVRKRQLLQRFGKPATWPPKKRTFSTIPWPSSDPSRRSSADGGDTAGRPSLLASELAPGPSVYYSVGDTPSNLLPAHRLKPTSTAYFTSSPRRLLESAGGIAHRDDQQNLRFNLRR